MKRVSGGIRTAREKLRDLGKPALKELIFTIAGREKMVDVDVNKNWCYCMHMELIPKF